MGGGEGKRRRKRDEGNVKQIFSGETVWKKRENENENENEKEGERKY